MSTILAATDFSRQALNALKYAFALGEKTHSKVVVFHTYTEPTADLRLPFPNINHLKKEALIDAGKKMKKLESYLGKLYPGVNFKSILMPGVASENIAHYAQEKRIGLVVMGTTGQGGLSRLLFGSTTAHVVRQVSCHVLAIPPQARFREIKKMAVATDLQDDNLSVLKDAASYAKIFDAHLMLMHVQEPEQFSQVDLYPEMVNKVKGRIKYKNLSLHVHMSTGVLNGLEVFVKKNKVNLFAMGTRHRKFPLSLLSRSLTNQLSMTIHVPLLIFHIPEIVKKKK
jgi:nucleotide-binding universal stress UspA family protein